MLHPYLESSVRKKKQCSGARKKRDLENMVEDAKPIDIPAGQKGYADVVMEAKEKQGDLLAVLSKAFSIEEVKI